MKEEIFEYDDGVVRGFVYATILWGLVGMLAGLWIALQLFLPALNFETPWLTFGRLRPLHTNAVIFAFCGNAIFAGIYDSSQRLLKTRMWSDKLSRLHLWGWQLIIVLAALTLPLGLTQSKEYAELEWPIDILITFVWVLFAVNFFMTLKIRRERILYVSIWFYIATIITIAMLHIVNNLALPWSPLNSYAIYAGVQDALIQWWYGHNAVAFFLTTPFLGLAYYYIPKATGTPIYSYRLSIVHFWSLIFIYIWAGPHHLQYTALPEWLQSLGMVFSVMLLAPSWGGAINFVLTLRMAWDRIKSEPLLKFFAAATTFYMMATFEGPLLSIKSINALSHNTDWTVGHVHSGALGWNGLLTFGMIYFLVPRLFNTRLYSKKLADLHFWLATTGILIYIVSMWISGITQGVMAAATNAAGFLKYPSFIEIVTTVVPLHALRATGGLLFVTGVVVMIVNVILTVRSATGPAVTTARALPLTRIKISEAKTLATKVEGFVQVMVPLVAIAVAVGGLVEVIPLLAVDGRGDSGVKVEPYRPLELTGRDIYIREGCNNCHTQMVRPLVHESLRYGDVSKAGEYIYDHPHLWGSKRTGPDLFRVGGKYNHVWHWKHMIRPQDVVVGSVMPPYPWLRDTQADMSTLSEKLAVLKILGVPYSDDNINNAAADAQAQAREIASELSLAGIEAQPESELIALISYLQRLGQRNTTTELGATP